MDVKYYFLKTLVKSYYDYQEMRIRFSNRLEIKKNGESMNKDVNRNTEFIVERDEENRIILQDLYNNCKEQETFIDKRIKKIVHKLPMWKHFFKDVKGCGELMAAVILTEYDIHKAVNVSKLVAFAGIAPGKDKLKKGVTSPYNTFLKAKLLGVLGSSFIKSNSPYRDIYDCTKNRLENSEVKVMHLGKMTAWKDVTKGHRHNASIRKMVKEFLKDLYVAWRTLEGLEVRQPYCEEFLNRKHSA